MPDDGHIGGRAYEDNLRIATRDEQAEEGELRAGVLLTILFDEVGKHMGVQVIDLDHRDAEGEGESLGEVRPDEE